MCSPHSILSVPDQRTGPRVLAFAYCPRAVDAPDAGIAALVQGVVRDVVGPDVVPDLLLAPRRERVDLDEAEFLVPRDDGDGLPRIGLVPPQARDPRRAALEGAAVRLDLAHGAAEVGVARPERLAKLDRLLVEAPPGAVGDGLDAVAALHVVDEVVGLGEEQVGVEIEDTDVRAQARRHVEQRHAGGTAEAAREGDIGVVGVERPAQNLLRRGALQLLSELLQQLAVNHSWL